MLQKFKEMEELCSEVFKKCLTQKMRPKLTLKEGTEVE